MKRRERWYSGRVASDVTVARWGHFGRPVIVFPTAGGDAEEIERMWLVELGGGVSRGRAGEALLVRQRIGGGDAAR